MENLKIRVNSEAESKEAQELFFELGYAKGACSAGNYPALIIATTESLFHKTPYSSRATRLKRKAHNQYKEITLPQLRDLVVLKRNDPKDANVIQDGDIACLYDLYMTSSKELYYFHCGKKKWLLSNLNQDEFYYKLLKPIEKPMKEYLIKSGDGKYLLTHHDSIGAIEIPEGATYYAKDASLGKSGNFFFRLRSDDFDFEAVWLESNWMQASFNVKNQEVLWQRHTHPEELPFIDDEPSQSLNDQYAEIETVRQDIINSPGHYADSTIECIDAMEAMMTPEQFIGYLRGNVFKYQWRYEKKNGIEDLKKAQWYLDKLTVKVAEKNALF